MVHFGPAEQMESVALAIIDTVFDFCQTKLALQDDFKMHQCIEVYHHRPCYSRAFLVDF